MFTKLQKCFIISRHFVFLKICIPLKYEEGSFPSAQHNSINFFLPMLVPCDVSIIKIELFQGYF